MWMVDNVASACMLFYPIQCNNKSLQGMHNQDYLLFILFENGLVKIWNFVCRNTSPAKLAIMNCFPQL